LKKLDISLSWRVFLRKFKKANSYHHLILNRSESLTLASIRDTLLPKLLTGQIRIKDAVRLIAKSV